MQLKIAIDWLNFTCDEPHSDTRFHYAYPAGKKRTTTKALHGYNRAYETELGARVMWHDTRDDMGVHIMYTGAVVNAHIDNGISSQEIASFHHRRGDRCTRIDLALDVVDSQLDIHALYGMIHKGKYTLPFNRKAALVTSTEGVTMYVGSRTSDLFLRVYDKGAEQGTDDNWKRVEIEVKGSRAMFFVNLLVTEGQLAAGQTARQVLKGIADFPTKDWQSIVGDEPMTVGKGENREKDTKEWLITQVAPAMGRYIARSGDGMILEQFLAIVAAFSEPEKVRECDK